MEQKKGRQVNKSMLIACCLAVAASAALAFAATKEGMVEYVGAQKNIFATGKAERIIHLSELAGKKNLFAIGPVEGLDGEITIYDSKPHISQVRGEDYHVDHSLNHGAIFLVWSDQEKWGNEIAVPETVRSYPDLQNFVVDQAKAAGAAGWLNKPFRPEQLLWVVKKFIR